MDISLQKLEQIMEILRSDNGCPWDKEQTFETLKHYLLEETYEVLEAMDNPKKQLKEELGDLLLQIVFQSQIAKEADLFTINDVLSSIISKMIRRHPHVFKSDGSILNETEKSDAITKNETKNNSITSDQVRKNWELQKRNERTAINNNASVLDGIPKTLPSLSYSFRLTEKAAKTGFDWQNIQLVWDKFDEELFELETAIKEQDESNIKNEFGDLLFTMVNLARFLKVNPEEALRCSNQKFERRFKYIEETLAKENKKPEELSLDELNILWESSKKLLI